MPDTPLTDEIKRMNSWWRLLAGLVNECLALGSDSRLSPEARLEKIREKLEFARQYTGELPPSVRAELDADPRVQAVLAQIRRRADESPAAGTETAWMMGEDGDFHEAALDQEPGERLQQDHQTQPERPEDGIGRAKG
jgi:hypothetical protein